MKNVVIKSAFLILTAFTLFMIPQAEAAVEYEVTVTNLTKGIILTPPIFATTRFNNQLSIFEAGQPSSSAIQKIAEGGDTSMLYDHFEAAGAVDVMTSPTPILPGESITMDVYGWPHGWLYFACMLVPTNDGFVALNGVKLRGLGSETYYLHAYDAGSEMNTEICADIPGPQCGGEGYNEEGGEGYIFPHPGTHGEADLSDEMYDWSDPVAMITVQRK
ncbi:MAG: spondin domain-containing protein [Candidatus Omnitrophica bacterium]|nr:spondin domain-containing protein [Candidatus Omnitrophota bacterium]